MRQWVTEAINKINADQHRSADTHLIKLSLPSLAGIDIYLKDESTHPTGSLKHRLARSLFLYALCNGKIHQHTTVVEASSGSTAVSEAYFARLIGVPFVAVIPRSTAVSKIKQVELYGGRCHFVEKASQMHQTAVDLAAEVDGYFMDQFANAERATDWRGNNNIAESIFAQMQYEPHPVPAHIVMSAGTGGTSATIGRYNRYKGYNTQLTVVDPENSAFYTGYTQGDKNYRNDVSSRIEGIGRPSMEASFQVDVIDAMQQVPDAASVATMHWLADLLGRKVGASTGTNMWGVLQLAKQMQAQGQQGSIVTLLCDSGERYLDTYYNEQWVAQQFGDVSTYSAQLTAIH